MAATNIYIVEGSEDGAITARTAARAAVLDALDYVKATDGTATYNPLKEYTRELKRDGFIQVGKWHGVTATVKRFIDRT